MAFAQSNYSNTPQGIPPTKYTLAQVGCFVTAFCNLEERYGRGLDPPALNAIFRDRGLYIDVDDGVRDDVAWNTISRYDPNTECLRTGVGNPPNDNCIVKFVYNGGRSTHFCLVKDAGAGTIIDSWDGKVKGWGVYGGVKAWAEYNNKQEDMINDTDNEYSRWAKLANQIRGRRAIFTRDEFRNSAVGRTWLQANEILSDDPEADTYFDRGHTNDGDTTNLYRIFLERDPEDSAKAYRFDILFKDNFYDILNSPEATALRAKKAADAAAKDKLIADLKTQVENGKAMVDPKLQAQLDKIDQNTADTKGLVQWIKDKLAVIFR